MAEGLVPQVCVLEPYGDIPRSLAGCGRALRHTGWTCFHTEMWTIHAGDRRPGRALP